MTRSWLLFVSVSSVLAAFIASVQHAGLGWMNAAISLLIGAVVSGFISVRHLQRWFGKFWLQASPWSRGFFVFILIGSLSVLLMNFGEVQGAWGTANPDNLGDLPFHLQLLKFFARGGSFPPLDPTYAGEGLHYPYGVDLWDALWLKIGVPEHTSLLITSICALLVTMIALHRAGGLVLLSAFFFSGGMALIPNWEKTFGPGSLLQWKNLFLAVFMTQRGFWWAIPAGVYLMRKWNRYLKVPEFRLGPAFCWIFAVLPFFHLHTFVVLSFWMLLTLIFDQQTEFQGPRSFHERLRRLPWGLIPASALALFFIFRSITHGNVSSSLAWNWGWLFTGLPSLVQNLGPWVVLPFFLIWRWVQKRHWKQISIALILTFFALNLQLAPWAWDQIKVLLWIYLLWTFWAVQEYKWKGSVAAIFSVFLFWPGAIQWWSGWPSMTGRFEIQNGADRASVQKLVEDLSADDIVAAKVDYRHPLLGSGQSLAMGFAGHVWSHGLDPALRQKQLDAVLLGSPDGVQVARELKVRWVVWKDEPNLGVPSPPLETWSGWGWKETKRIGKWHLWQVVVGDSQSH